MSSFTGQQLSVAARPVAAKRVDTTVRAAAKKAPAKKAPVKTANKGANKWLASDSGFDASKFYGPDRVLFLPGGRRCIGLIQNQLARRE